MDNAVVPDAWAALTKAQGLAPKASEQEQGYSRRWRLYAAEPVEIAPLDLAFADAMRDLKNAYPDDLDAATIFAESLMDTIPWNDWTPEGEPPEATVEILATLESVLAGTLTIPALITITSMRQRRLAIPTEPSIAPNVLRPWCRALGT